MVDNSSRNRILLYQTCATYKLNCTPCVINKYNWPCVREIPISLSWNLQIEKVQDTILKPGLGKEIQLRFVHTRAHWIYIIYIHMWHVSVNIIIYIYALFIWAGFRSEYMRYAVRKYFNNHACILLKWSKQQFFG